jgi:hypothetical protein
MFVYTGHTLNRINKRRVYDLKSLMLLPGEEI